MIFFKYIIIFLLSFAPIYGESQTPPDVFLEQSVKEVSAFISENKTQLEEDSRFLEKKMNDLVIPKFDILLMSKIVLGKKNWTNMNSNQQNRFVSAFKGLMVRTYMKSLTVFEGEKINFLPYEPGKRNDVAKVQSLYVMDEGNLPVDYRLKLNKDKQWKVFDIIIDGISLLKNYRKDFKNHIKKQDIESLIDKLNEN